MTDRKQQSVELLKLLGEDTAEAVLSHMPEEYAAKIRSQIQGNPAQGMRTKQKRALLNDFEWFFEFALKSSPHNLNVFDDDAAAQEEQEAEENEKKIRLTGNAMKDLQLLSIHQLSGALETEQPRTIAILLNNVPPELAANVLSLFPDELREDVARQLSREQNAPQVLVERISRATVQRGATLPSGPQDRRDHADRLSEVLRAVPKSYRRAMMEAIEEEDADLSAALMKKLYRFADIVSLDPQAVQQVLGEIDGTTLTTAMFGAEQEIVDTIMGNLSRRARLTIEEELQFITRVPESKVTSARETVSELIAKIDQEGE
ncbi:MAG: FliG C-terminal domain-containing protein [Fuerstiella sp.]